MKHIYKIISIGILLVSNSLMAQHDTNFTFYRNQMNSINPAYAGIDNKTILSASMRSQWSGIEGAPVTQALTFGTSVGNNLGLGLSVVNEKTFIEKQTSVAIDFSYLVKMNKSTDLYFGLKAGGNFFNVNAAGLELYSMDIDPAFGTINSFTPNVGVGAVLKNDKYYLSLSVPKLFSFKQAKNENGYAMLDTKRPQVYASAGYDINLNADASFVLKPSIMARYVTAVPISIDFSTMLMINNNLEIGGLYRTDKAYAAMASIVVSKKLVFGFAYEMSSRAELASVKNTNEFLLQYKF